MDKTLYCRSCGQAGHANKDCPSQQRHAHNVNNPMRKPIVPAKDSKKETVKHLSKEFKCSHCGWNNHAVENCFALYPKKCPSSEREQTLEANIGILKERFKILTSSGQILDLPAPSRAKAGSSAPDSYMFGASCEVIGLTAVTRAQSVSRATPSTTEEFVESLRARGNGPMDQVRLPLSFWLADVVQTVNGCNSSMDASNAAIDMVNSLVAKVLHTHFFTTTEWLPSNIQSSKIFHLTYRILEGKTSSSSLTVAQATANILTYEDHEEAAKRRAMLAVEAITSFDVHTLDGGGGGDHILSPIRIYGCNFFLICSCYICSQAPGYSTRCRAYGE